MTRRNQIASCIDNKALAIDNKTCRNCNKTNVVGDLGCLHRLRRSVMTRCVVSARTQKSTCFGLYLSRTYNGHSGGKRRWVTPQVLDNTLQRPKTPLPTPDHNINTPICARVFSLTVNVNTCYTSPRFTTCSIM